MNKSQKKKVRQTANEKLTPEEVQHLRRCGLTITNKTKSPSKRPLRRFAAWWDTTSLEKFLEDVVFLLKNAALLDIINLLASITIIISLGTWWTGRKERWEDEIFSTWKIVNEAAGDESGVAKLAVERLLRNEFSLAGLDLSKTNLRGTNLQKGRLDGANLQQAVLEKAELQQARLDGANLQEARLDGANLQRVNLWSANLQQARLSSVNLQEANLLNTNLQEAKLWNANLQQAKLLGANLQEATLERVNLQEARLEGANLQEATLERANFQQANLLGANLQDAILIGAKNLNFEQIKSACNWKEAIYKRDKEENQNFIKELKNDTSSDPENRVDCSIWKTSVRRD